MSTIKTWTKLLNERIGDMQITTDDDVRLAMRDHIDALTEALKAAHEENTANMSTCKGIISGLTAERDTLQAKLSAIEAQEPVEGWKLVPAQSTREMDKAGQNALEECGFCDCGNPHRANAEEAYTAMLAAAPVAPAQPVCHPAKVTSDAIGGGTALIDLSGAQPVNELVEALQEFGYHHERCDKHGNLLDEKFAPACTCGFDAALANAKAAQPLTKEQLREHTLDEVNEAIEIMKGQQ
jgi:hypothetical protein